MEVPPCDTLLTLTLFMDEWMNTPYTAMNKNKSTCGAKKVDCGCHFAKMLTYSIPVVTYCVSILAFFLLLNLNPFCHNSDLLFQILTYFVC